MISVERQWQGTECSAAGVKHDEHETVNEYGQMRGRRKSMNELQVEVRLTAGEIACNFDDIESALRTQMTAYEELEVTEDNIPERKADVATLRKIRGAVDDKRKEIKRDFSKPLTEFEGRVKKIEGIIDEQIDRINDGLTAFENKRIAAKREVIKQIYDRECEGYTEYLPLESIRSSKWDNKTVSDKDIASEIQEMVLRVKSDLAAIEGLQSEIKDKLLLVYKSSGNNLSAAIQRNTEYLDAKRAAEERIRAEAEAKQREEATSQRQGQY